MADLGVSIVLIAAVVLVCEAARRAAGRLRSRDLGQYLVEAVSTLQLCACTQEVKLLADLDQLDPGAGLTLTYVLTCVHLATGGGASCNPVGVLDRLRQDRTRSGTRSGTRSARGAAGLVCCQFAAAVAARSWAVWVWGLGLSDLHAGIRESGFRCRDPIRGPLVLAAAVETLCAFCMQAASMQVHLLDPRLRIPAVSAVVTCLVYAGGSVSGAVFNPVLAFSIQFPCSGHTFPEYCCVYWLGPALGVSSCVLLFEKVIPVLSGRSGVGQTAGTGTPSVPRSKKTR